MYAVETWSYLLISLLCWVMGLLHSLSIRASLHIGGVYGKISSL
jgi:hypothetical protein